jgi:ubiquinone/menaquinone biosynthesis C-methylase UbiE
MQRTAFERDVRAHAALSALKVAWWAANGFAAKAMAKPGQGEETARVRASSPPPPKGYLRQAWFEAFRKDAADVAAGLYPLTEAPPADPVRIVATAADFLGDARVVDARRRRAEATEAREEADSQAYPAYYRQNFHYQSGGWFTAESARRYEAQVETLFTGTAGPMRRRALSLLSKAWRDRDQRELSLLDLACGSGAFLDDLRATFPRARILGLDLSTAYLGEAQTRSGLPMVQAKAEQLPFKDASLDGVSCVYLFHELPSKVRPVVAREIARVLKPGGVLAFADSVQAQDEPQLARLLESFPVFFHEPYFESYQATDLEDLFGRAGLRSKDSDQAFLTKAVLFGKP